MSLFTNLEEREIENVSAMPNMCYISKRYRPVASRQLNKNYMSKNQGQKQCRPCKINY